MMDDLILGIETSCDDTSLALVSRAGAVVAAETVSQYAVHAPHGGVYPELASRAHLDAILPTLERVMGQCDPADLTAIAVTRGPGLMGSLLVGLSTAQALGIAWNKPVIGVNHLRGHLRSADLEEQRLEFPAILLLASGGHTLIAHAKTPWDIELLGTTRDDSVGECYDKVARMLGLGMPGGPALDRCAAQGQVTTRFPRPMKNEGYEFSFSGLKSSVARHLETNADYALNDVAASFEAACLDVLSAKIGRALEAHRPACLAIVGGVAASAPLRARMAQLAESCSTKLCLPPQKWATDNGAMIALAGWDYWERNVAPALEPKPNLPLQDF